MQKNNKIDFIGIATPKAATTWIFECLCEHPQICGSSAKEVSFFYREREYGRGPEHYQSFFNHCEAGQIVGEFSPQYLASEKAPLRIKEHFPDIKLIACLRNPVERAYSHYWYTLHNSRLRSTLYSNFREAAEKDPAVLSQGFYYKHLERWLKLYPRENIKIVFYEDIKKDPIAFIQKLYDFLSLDSDFVPRSARQTVNASEAIKEKRDKIPLVRPFLVCSRDIIRSTPLEKAFVAVNYRIGAGEIAKKLLRQNTIQGKAEAPKRPPMNPEDRRFLQDIYAEDIAKLQNLLDKDLSHWK